MPVQKNPQGSASLVSHSVEVTARPALDVWSFAVMALEILCGFRLMDDTRDAPPEVRVCTLHPGLLLLFRPACCPTAPGAPATVP